MKVYGKSVTRGHGWAYVQSVGPIVVPEGVSDRDVKRIAKGALKCKAAAERQIKAREKTWAAILEG